MEECLELPGGHVHTGLGDEFPVLVLPMVQPYKPGMSISLSLGPLLDMFCIKIVHPVDHANCGWKGPLII